MIFVCALLTLASVCVSLSFGGATSPFALLQTLAFLPLFGKIGRMGRIRIMLVPVCTVSVIMRSLSLYVLARGAVGSWGAVILITLSAALAGWSAYNGASAMHSPAPVFFLSVLLAIYTTAVSFSSPLRAHFGSPDALECISALVCPFSACAAFSRLSTFPPMQRLKGALAGAAVCAVFLLFKIAGAEFGFICVPLTVCVSAIEIKAVVSVISERFAE